MKFRVLIDNLLIGEDANKHFTDAIYYEPDELAQDNFAKIFLHIEILDNPKNSRQITQTIIETVKNHLYKDLKKDPYAAFEESLKLVNQELKKLKYDDKEWIGKINSTIGVLSGDELHLSTTGTADVLLTRNEKISRISEGLAPSKEDYENIFLNIASGSLKEDDHLLISNSSITDKLAEDQIINAISRKQLANAVLSLERLLDKRYHSCLLLNVKSAYLKEESIYDKEDIVEEIEQYDNADSEQAQIQQTSQKNRIDATKYLNSGKNFIFKLKEIFIPPADKQMIDEEISDDDILEEDEERDYQSSNIRHDIIGIDKKDSLDDIKHAAHLNKMYDSTNDFNTTDNKFSNTLNLLKKNIFNSLKGITPNKKRRSFKKANIIGITIILLAIIFAVNSIHSKYVENQKIELLRADLLNIDTLIEKAKGRNIIDEKSKAREILTQIYDEIDKVKNSEYLKNEIEDKENEVIKLANNINQIITVDVPKEYANLEAKYSGVKGQELVFLNDDIYVIAEDAILKLILDQVVTIPVNILNENEKILRATTFETESSILLYTNQNRIIEFKRDQFTENKITSGDSWYQANAIGSFGRRIYLLDSTANQVWKYTKQASGFLAPEEYKPYDHELSDALDMSIVGDIYFLKQNGKIIRTNSRETVEFEFNEIPKDTDFGTASRIEFNPTLKQLFILDPPNNRILVTGYRGLYAKQYVFPDLIADLKDIYVNENSRKLYVLSSTKVYEIDLES